MKTLQELCLRFLADNPEFAKPRTDEQREQLSKFDKMTREKWDLALIPPTLEELNEKLYVVHATDYFPVNHISKTGEVKPEQAESTLLTMRMTVHVAIGGLVRSHGTSIFGGFDNDWSNKSFYIIDKLAHAEDIMNFYPYDTYRYQQWLWSRDAVVLVREDKLNEVPEDCGFTTIPFEMKANARPLIEAQITKRGGWVIETRDNQGGIGSYGRLVDASTYRNFDVCNPYFYSNYLLTHPNVVFGAVAYSETHSTTYAPLMKTIDRLLGKELRYTVSEIASIEVAFALVSADMINIYIHYFQNVLQDDGFIEHIERSFSKEFANQYFSNLYFTLFMLKCDSKIRADKNLTIAYSSNRYPELYLAWRRAIHSDIYQASDKFAAVEECLVSDCKQLSEIICNDNVSDDQAGKWRENKLAALSFHEFDIWEILTRLPLHLFEKLLPSIQSIETGTKVYIYFMDPLPKDAEVFRLYLALGYYSLRYLSSENERYYKLVKQSARKIQDKYGYDDIKDVMTDFRMRFYMIYDSLVDGVLAKVDKSSHKCWAANRLLSLLTLARHDDPIMAGRDLMVLNVVADNQLKLALQSNLCRLPGTQSLSKLSINTTDQDGNTLLIHAARHGLIALIPFLIELGANAKIVAKDGDNALSLYLKWLDNSSFFNPGKAGSLILPKEMIRLLVNSGADVNQMIENGETLLTQAIRNNKMTTDNTALLLLEHDIDINKPNSRGWTPLFLALLHEEVFITRRLLQLGASTKDTSLYPSQVKFCLTQLDISKMMFRNIIKSISHEAIQAHRFANGDSLLHIASSVDTNPEVFAVVLSLYNDVDVRNDEGETPLHIACREQQYLLVNLLIKAGADVNAANHLGERPIDLAEYDSTLHAVIDEAHAIRLFK